MVIHDLLPLTQLPQYNILVSLGHMGDILIIN